MFFICVHTEVAAIIFTTMFYSIYIVLLHIIHIYILFIHWILLDIFGVFKEVYFHVLVDKF